MIDFTDKFLSVVSTPRTGSVWFSHLIYQYCREVHGFKQLLTEPFNEYHYNLWYEDMPGYRKNHQTWSPERYRLSYDMLNGEVVQDKAHYASGDPGKVHTKLETTQRAKVISNGNKIVMHNHVSPLDNVAKAFIYSFPCIFVGRKDKWEQLLSYGVAYHTKVFARFRGAPQTVPQAEEIEFPVQIADDLLFRIEAFEQARREQEFPTIWYEDMNFEQPEKTLELLGINWQPEIPFGLPLKQTPGNKESYFKNLDEIRWIYNKHKPHLEKP